METAPEDLTAEVGHLMKTERELVSPHEFQINFSYKEGPKKWINLKVEEGGPDLSRMRVEKEIGRAHV